MATDPRSIVQAPTSTNLIKETLLTPASVSAANLAATPAHAPVVVAKPSAVSPSGPKDLGGETASEQAVKEKAAEVNALLEQVVILVDTATEGYLMSQEHREVTRAAIRSLKIPVA